ncbi:Fic family protein [Lachnospiraceae bacterium PM6-15]|uniref:Fic family protein n=1 Tax=Ohessyouella blattaphilus TaxID=2949333 RepID=UPI003E22D4F8
MKDIQMNELIEQYKKCVDVIPEESIKSYRQDFFVNYTYNSTAIEGNTLTLLEQKTVLEDNIAIGGKSLREIFEVYNHKKAFDYLEKCLSENQPLSENIVKELHAILTENVMVGGVYRDYPVRISGASFTPVTGNQMFYDLKNFYADMEWKPKDNALEYASWVHAEFVKIHPFGDGNGRTARMLLNYQLMQSGLLPVQIKKEQRLTYYEALDQYATKNELEPFTKFVSEMEKIELTNYVEMSKEIKKMKKKDVSR